MNRATQKLAFMIPILLIGLIGVNVARGQYIPDKPNEVENIDILEHLNALLPMDEEYFNEDGQKYPLSEYFRGSKPVLISFNYSNCPKLCDAQLTGLVRTLQQMKLKPNDDFHYISLSIDANERPERARESRNTYLGRYGDLSTKDGWHFLTGDQNAINRITSVAGFEYTFIRETNEFAHAPVFIVCTPDGRISRYLYGIEIEPQLMRLSLVEAADGKIGNSMDQIILWCFNYDPHSNSYVPQALNLMKIAGAATIVVIVAICVPFWFTRPRRGKANEAKPTEETAVNDVEPTDST